MTNKANAWKARYSLLHQFFRGYLHQDFPEEYGSIAGALRQYHADAGDSEFARFRREWEAFLAETGKLSASEIDRIFSEGFGGSWHVASRREIDRFTEAVKKSGGPA